MFFVRPVVSFFFAKISLRSPKKSISFYEQRNVFSGSQYPSNIDLILTIEALVRTGKGWRKGKLQVHGF